MTLICMRELTGTGSEWSAATIRSQMSYGAYGGGRKVLYPPEAEGGKKPGSVARLRERPLAALKGGYERKMFAGQIAEHDGDSHERLGLCFRLY